MVKINSDYLIPFCFTLIYILLPSHNSGIDAYAYAYSIKSGFELVWPHHLLYVPLGRLLYTSLSMIQPLVLMKLLNAIVAGSVLIIMNKIIRQLNISNRHAFTLFIGSTFGIMRFATENETYLLPILFSLWASYLFLKYLQTPSILRLIGSSLLFGIGVLFHQIHAFWFLGFIITSLTTFKKSVKFIFPMAGILLITTGYLLAYHYSNYETGLLKFMLHDVYAGQVNTSLGVNNFLMTPISFIRSFIQVHGYIATLLKSNPVLWLVPISFVIIFLKSLRLLFKYSQKHSPSPIFSKAIFFAMALQFIFAFYSVGNAEFMVMVPLLLSLWLLLNFSMPTLPIYHTSLIILVWNLVFGIAPYRFLDLDGSLQLLGKMDTYPQAYWVLSEPQKIENMASYYGKIAPKILKIHDEDLARNTIGNLLNKDFILTNIINRDIALNRKTLLSKSNHTSEILKFYNVKTIDSIDYFGGKMKISKIVSN